MTKSISRMQLMSGDISGERIPLRPPWALAEHLFIERCTRCGECLAVCKPMALVRGEDRSPPWRLKAAILPNCLSLNAVVCRSCGEACDEKAISFQLEPGGVAKPMLDRESCTGCGECFAVCPIKSVKISSNEPRDQAA